MAKPKQSRAVPQIVIKNLASGLILMAVFTAVWLGMACSTLEGRMFWGGVIALLVICLSFVGYALHLFKKSKAFPAKINKVERTTEEQKRRGIAVVFGLGGFFIASTCGVLYAVDLLDYSIPAIALIFGVHLYPLGNIFKRNFDYLIGTWATMMAVMILLLTLVGMLDTAQSHLFSGITSGLATIGYGIYMISRGQKYKQALQH